MTRDEAMARLREQLRGETIAARHAPFPDERSRGAANADALALAIRWGELLGDVAACEDRAFMPTDYYALVAIPRPTLWDAVREAAR